MFLNDTNHLPAPSLADAFGEFLIDRRASSLSPSTLRYYQDELAPFLHCLALQGVSYINEITPEIIREHLLELSGRRNPGGVHIRYRTIKTWLRWAWEEYEFDNRNPITRVKPPKVSTAPLPGIPLEHVFRMVSVCKTDFAARDKAALLVLLDTAARRAEFLALNWDDVNLISGDVLIRSGKGGKPRTVHLGKHALKALRAWQRIAPKGHAIWTSQTRERLTNDGLRQIVRRRALDAGIPAPGLHDFRRASLLAMLRNGADAVTVSRYAGHADVRVTLRYLAQTDDDLREAHARSSPVDNWL